MRVQNVFPLRGRGRNKERESWREVGPGREGEAERVRGEREKAEERGNFLYIFLSCYPAAW